MDIVGEADAAAEKLFAAEAATSRRMRDLLTCVFAGNNAVANMLGLSNEDADTLFSGSNMDACIAITASVLWPTSPDGAATSDNSTGADSANAYSVAADRGRSQAMASMAKELVGVCSESGQLVSVDTTGVRKQRLQRNAPGRNVIRLLVPLMCASSRLRTVRVVGCGLTDAGVEEIAMAVMLSGRIGAAKPRLQLVDVSNNALVTSAGGRALMAIVKQKQRCPAELPALLAVLCAGTQVPKAFVKRLDQELDETLDDPDLGA
jgi:hypothetical protein